MIARGTKQDGLRPWRRGAWAAAAELPVRTPAQVLWINDASAYHRVLGFWVPPEPPAWLEAQGVVLDAHDHDHGDGGHDHGDMGALAFDIEVDGGAWLEMDLDGEGTLLLHCHPHPWMEVEWEVVPAAPRGYPVVVHRVVVVGQAAGETAEGETEQRSLTLDAPNLLRVEAVLAWDDGKDDFMGQGELNEPDTLRLTIRDPSGQVVAEDAQTARHGDLRVEFRPPGPGWPERLDAASAAEARQALWAQEDESLSGTWTFEVSVVSAPGAAEGLPQGVPGADGKQEWNLTVKGVHGWADVGQDAPAEHRVGRDLQ